MKTRNRSDRTGARATRVAASSLLALSALGTGVGSALAAGGSGSIWTTDDPCTELATQNQNLYAAGDTVYVRGSKFGASSAVSWSITGMPGGASGDPGLVVASGSGATDADGAFCLEGYEVAADDWGVYSVDVTQGRVSKNDNYRVEEVAPPADETPADPPADPPADETPADPPADPPADETPADPPADPPVDELPPSDQPADETPADQTPADETPADEQTPPADETPADEAPADEPTPPADETPADEQTPPADETTVEQPVVDEPAAEEPPVEEPTDPQPAEESTDVPPPPTVDDESATTDPNDGATDPADPPAAEEAGDPPTQQVLGAVSSGGSNDLPATDSATDVMTGSSSLLIILGLSGLAFSAVLFAPIRRREPEATE